MPALATRLEQLDAAEGELLGVIDEDHRGSRSVTSVPAGAVRSTPTASRTSPAASRCAPRMSARTCRYSSRNDAIDSHTGTRVRAPERAQPLGLDAERRALGQERAHLGAEALRRADDRHRATRAICRARPPRLRHRPRAGPGRAGPRRRPSAAAAARRPRRPRSRARADTRTTRSTARSDPMWRGRRRARADRAARWRSAATASARAARRDRSPPRRARRRAPRASWSCRCPEHPTTTPDAAAGESDDGALLRVRRERRAGSVTGVHGFDASARRRHDSRDEADIERSPRAFAPAGEAPGPCRRVAMRAGHPGARGPGAQPRRRRYFTWRSASASRTPAVSSTSRPASRPPTSRSRSRARSTRARRT